MKIRLITGREVDANGEIIGIDGNGNTFEGYDDPIYASEWPIDDRIALSELMIGRWEKFRNKAKNEKAGN